MTLGYTSILWILVGAYFYAGLAHLQVGLRRPMRRLHVLFGLIALAAAFAAIATVELAMAPTPAAYVTGAWHSTISVGSLFVLLPWCVRDYIAQRALWPAASISAIYIAILAIDVSVPYSLMLSAPPQLGRALLPWGEEIVRSVTPPHPLLKTYWIAHLFTIAYFVYAIAYAIRRRPRVITWGLTLSVAPFAISLVINIFIGFGIVKSSMFVGSFGFMAMVLAMSITLSESLRRSSRQMQTVLDNVPAVVYLKHRNGRYAFVNRKFEDVYGVASTAVLGKRDIDVFNPERAAMSERADQDVLSKGATLESEETISRDGQSRAYATLRFPLRDHEGAVYAICGIATDVTDRNAAAEAVRNLAETLERRVARRTRELAQLNRELEAFAYSVSHDLRAPLTAVNGFAELLLREHGTKLDQTAQRYINRIRDGSLRMASLIQDLLGLSRVTQQALDRKSIDLGALAEDSLKTLRESDPSRTVVCVVPQSLLANGDEKLLALALNNLLANAWKYTSKTTDARIELGSFDQAGETVYFVKDNGAGFNPDHTERLFRPFVRLHSESEFPGTGIGLATVARIIGRHGGRIWAEGKPGAGATFFFTLPTGEEEFPEATTYVESLGA